MDIPDWHNVYTQRALAPPSDWTVQDADLGQVLADSKGKTIYYYSCNDDAEDQQSCDSPDAPQVYRLAICGNFDPKVCNETFPYVQAQSGEKADSTLWSVISIDPNTGKLAQASVCGAELLVVRGTYSDAYALAVAAGRVLPYLNTTTTFVSPHSVDGGRTLGLELHEQTGPKAPDWVVVPIGVGPLLVGIHEAYELLHAHGAVDRVPRLLAVQAAGCAPIVRAFDRRAEVVEAWGRPTTVVGALADPLAGYEAEALLTLRSIRATDGAAVAIEDDVTLAWLRRIAVSEGLFVEPAAAITLAAVEQAVANGWITSSDRVACCLTGTGLKDPMVALTDDERPLISATEEAIMHYLTARPGRRTP